MFCIFLPLFGIPQGIEIQYNGPAVNLIENERTGKSYSENVVEENFSEH